MEGEHGFVEEHRFGEGLCAEQHPADSYNEESENHCGNLSQFVQEFCHAYSVCNLEKSVVSTPQHKVPGSAVPESRQQKHKHKVEICTCGAATVSAKWNVEIVFHKIPERDMPSAPKFADT